MKVFPYQLIKKGQLRHLNEIITGQENQIAKASEFIAQIEQGNLDATYHLGDDSDDAGLSKALLSMRKQLKQISDEEKERKWVTEGLAKFADILRSKRDSIGEMSDYVISHLVNYMNANQGALYFVNDDDPTDVFIEMKGCYAYGRKKHINQRIAVGQGLVGQTYREGQYTYMTDIPGDYLKITSGLGEALPRHLLIMPLKLEEDILGIIELASFNDIHDYQIRFVEKLGQSIASTIASVKTNERTNKLLEETQSQAEEMRSQEEEMRQNMEELSATQEELQRVLNEVNGKERYLNNVLNATSDSVFTLDNAYQLISYNESFRVAVEASGVSLKKGFSILQLFGESKDRDRQVSHYQRAFNGESFQVYDELEVPGGTMHFAATYKPLYDDESQIYAIAVFSKDVTEMMQAKHEADKLAQASQEQAEELRAQEEEMRQNMEELTTTQEEMQRLFNEVQGKEQYLNAVLNASSDSIFTIDKEYKLISFNDTFKGGVEGLGLTVEKGLPMLEIFGKEDAQRQKANYDRAFAGETYSILDEMDTEGGKMYFSSTFTPLYNEGQEIYAVAGFAKDVTEMMQAKHEAENLAKSSQEQAEELRAQEEEMRQNMEELTATQEEMQRLFDEVQGKEKYLTEILNATSDSVFTLDRDYKLISFNETFQGAVEASGVKLEKGFDILQLLEADKDKAAQIANYKRVFAGEAFKVVNEIETAYGNMYFEGSYTPLYDEQGGVYAAAVFSKDVTETMKAKSGESTEPLKGQVTYLTAILDSIGHGVLVIDRAHKVQHVNKLLANKMKSCGIDIKINAGLSTLFDEAIYEQQRADLEKAFAGQFLAETSITFYKGGNIYYKANYSPLLDESHEVYAVVISVHDIMNLSQNNVESRQMA